MNSDPEGPGRQLGGNKEFLEAVVAVCALMANADDDVVLCERSSISAAIATDRDFEHFDKNVVDRHCHVNRFYSEIAVNCRWSPYAFSMT